MSNNTHSARRQSHKLNTVQAHKAEAARDSRRAFALRLGIFVIVAVLVLGGGIYLALPRIAGGSEQAQQTVEITMAGYTPDHLKVAAGQPVTVRLVNPDSSHHTDGGGLHQFAIPDLGLDVKVNPQSATVFTIPAAQAGTYTFYCDVCCGGKENPSMRGTLTVS